MNRSNALIEIDGIRKSFGTFEVLKGISLSVGKGEAVCIIGPSGSGKSTILRCINGLIPVNEGFIRVGNHKVHEMRTEKAMRPLRHQVAMVFQQYNLFPHRTALENIMMAPIQVLGHDKAEVADRARKLLAKVRLSEKADSYPGQLSGGQQQRVAIARALAMQPEVILFDEVTAALDPETVKEVLVTIRELVEEGLTCVLVTHEMKFAREVSHRVYFTDRGLIVESAPPVELFDHPKDPRTREFLGQVL
ncbi:amino acid ABC transporter ATP-binding protein [Agrobacterium tumefaciens]|uniref:amino acid ABC transporter ATP-binding protein n=1 Tax=Agrobacterium tumefaciens TaxID=358 RepID=UPI002A16436F|nr:amino acid ABC transporter ATP-binding protein [Agrobacterium tumefaciens]MDX8326168.1 amino acid ABC transporter ATP-binding protein [Agrobacterium tumefaciens]